MPNTRAYLELTRLPNVFSAAADVLMGYLITHEGLLPWPPAVLLIGSSCSLYTAGMVLNDVFDREQDARERPQRPIPSGRVSIAGATRLGFTLLILGIALGWGASLASGDWRSGAVATLLALAVVAYDIYLKRTPLGPFGMGACRLLNVLLGMSAAAFAWQTMHWLVAGGVGLYIVGVTWFARTEARESSRVQLALATAVLLGGVALLWWFPRWTNASIPAYAEPVYAIVLGTRWHLLMLVLGLLIGWRCVLAVADPSPGPVQTAIKQCIMSLIVLDAACCLAVRGPQWAMVILLLLVPSMLLGRWIYST